MLILKMFLVPLLALILLGIVFAIGTIGLVSPRYANRNDQSDPVDESEYTYASTLSYTQPVTSMPIGESTNAAIVMSTANDQLDYGLNSLIINI